MGRSNTDLGFCVPYTVLAVASPGEMTCRVHFTESAIFSAD